MDLIILYSALIFSESVIIFFCLYLFFWFLGKKYRPFRLAHQEYLTLRSMFSK